MSKFRKLAVAVMVTAATATMVSAHLPSGRSIDLRAGEAGKSLGALRFDTKASEADPYDSNKEYNKAGMVCSEGEFKGTKMYWTNAWWVKGEKPGEFADSGGTSAWGLINSFAYTQDKDYEWVGWNSNVTKYKIFKPAGTHDITVEEDGNWGDQLDKKGAGAYIPTWRDGAEAAYTMIHDDIGAMSYEGSVEPAVEVGREYPWINVGWGVKVDAMDDEEWAQARQMVLEGHEMLNHSYDHTSAADQWQWFFHGDTLSAEDPSIPPEIRNLVVDSSLTGGKDLSFKLKYIDYIDGDPTKPDTLEEDAKYTVSSDYKKDENPDLEKNIWKNTGKIKAVHKGWSEDAAANVSMLKVFCVPGWTDSRYKVNVDESKKLMDDNVYKHPDVLNKARDFPLGQMTSYYVYPYDAYSNTTHDYLFQTGHIGSRGGAKSGIPTPGDFFHPQRLDFDAFFMLDEKATKVFPDNPHQRLSLQGLVDNLIKSKGYMIREFHACADVDVWSDANLHEKGGWWGGIPKSLYSEHLKMLDGKKNSHEICVFTPTETVQYRITANNASNPTVSKDSDNVFKLSVDGGSTPEEYRDEISIIVVLDEAIPDNIEVGAVYSDASVRQPRYQPRQMDDSRKKWSVSINPFLGDVLFGDVDAEGIVQQKMNSVTSAAYNGISSGKVSLCLPSGDYSAALISANGRVVQSVNFTANSAITTTGLVTESLAQGIYFLNVTKAGNSVLKQKIVLQ